ncbi:MAG: hypothetical protein PGN25_18695 [Methylorubrum populi]
MSITKIDLRKRYREINRVSAATFSETLAPPLTFVKINGEGAPKTAGAYRMIVAWLYGASYAMKFATKALGRDYVGPSLEALW